jgi:YgiT-type zinc finger domain-containing protein
MGARLRKEKKLMKCVVCKWGETRPGTTTATLERDGATLVVKNVPARVCNNCGEAYVEQEIAQRLLTTAREALRAGVHVDVRDFAATIST